MKKSTDLRVVRTRRWLQGALRDLMAEKPYQKIKIAEIVYKAEVARPTFYLHYASKDELLLSLFNELFTDFRESLASELKLNNVDHKLFGTLIFKYARQNAEGFRVLLDAGVEHLVQDRFRSIIGEISREVRTIDPTTTQAAVLVPYINDFIANGIFTLLKRWIQEDMPIPDEKMGLLIASVVETLRSIVTDKPPPMT